MPGKDVGIALDPAASAFAVEGGYDLTKSGGGMKTSEEMTALYARWIDTYPIVSIEDGLGEHDWAGLRRAYRGAGRPGADRRRRPLRDQHALHRPRHRRADATNAVLIKLNQIGTVTETIEAIEMCRQAGLALRGVAPLGRDRRQLHRRFRGGHGGRADQDRLALPQRAHRQVQPAAGNRAGAWGGGGLRQPVLILPACGAAAPAQWYDR